jgi:hypothetical protein
MKKLLLVPVVLLAACADVKPDDGQVVVGTAVDDDGGGGGGGADNENFRTLTAGFITEPAECNDHSTRIEGHFGYSDGSLADNVTCQLLFEDGTSVEGCFAVHSFAEPQNVTLIATDSVTGATATYEEVVSGPLSFSATLDVTSSGLSISWNADAIYGTSPGVGQTLVSIEPAANVIVNDPAIFQQRTGTVEVTAAGTYTVTVGATLQFAEVGGCFASVDKTIDIPSDTPPCPTTKHAD